MRRLVRLRVAEKARPELAKDLLAHHVEALDRRDRTVHLEHVDFV